MSAVLLRGFADPVQDSRAVFRAVLDAMARPGTIHAVAAPAVSPAPLGRAAAAALLTLADNDTPLWLGPGAEAAAEWAVFHCGTPMVEAASARLAFALAPVGLDAFSAGTDEEPELSATLIRQVAALGSGIGYRLAGPGLATPATLAVDGLEDGFVAEWDANRRRFPRGVDVILCAGDHLAALPRTVSLAALPRTVSLAALPRTGSFAALPRTGRMERG